MPRPRHGSRPQLLEYNFIPHVVLFGRYPFLKVTSLRSPPTLSSSAAQRLAHSLVFFPTKPECNQHRHNDLLKVIVHLLVNLCHHLLSVLHSLNILFLQFSAFCFLASQILRPKLPPPFPPLPQTLLPNYSTPPLQLEVDFPLWLIILINIIIYNFAT